MKKEMFQAEMLTQQLRQTEEQLRHLQEQHNEMVRLRDDLDTFKEVKQNDELLVPLVPGIFAEATATGRPDLLVNVGLGTLVRKTPDEVREQVGVQLERLEQHEQEVRKTFETLLQELDTLKESFKE